MSKLVNSNNQTLEITREEGKVFLSLGWTYLDFEESIALTPAEMMWLIEQLEAQLKEKA